MVAHRLTNTFIFAAAHSDSVNGRMGPSPFFRSGLEFNLLHYRISGELARFGWGLGFIDSTLG